LGRQRQTSTEAALDALRDGYEVDPVVDAVGGTSLEAHRTAWNSSPGFLPAGHRPEDRRR
jgi:hypothetical protein